MKKIIVPTDFSATSIVAFRYALPLAEALGIKEIKLISVYHEPINVKDEAYISALAVEEAKRKCEAKLLEFIEIENFRHPLSIKVSFEAIHGYASNRLIEAAEESDVALIVMGTTGAHDTLDAWLGPVSLNVARYARRPVLLVPTAVKYAPIEQILYACDFKQTDFDLHAEGILAEWAKKFNAKVKVLFISKDGDEYTLDQTVMREIFRLDAPQVPISTQVLESPATVQTIKNYALEMAFDLIVMATQKRDFSKSYSIKVLLKNSLGTPTYLFWCFIKRILENKIETA
ncbi:MAG: universal stress protein [Saprospiraceae bacterium]|nr:universal stress protein [Saprospiraceae bacterium]